MTTAALPAAAKVQELRLAVECPTDEVRRPLTRKAPYAAPMREMWRGEVLFAPMTQADARAVAAFFDGLDGRVTPFRLPLKGGVHTVENASTSGTLAAAVASGADRISLAKGTSAELLPGTLIAIGDIDTTAFQLVEVIAGGSVATTQTVIIAPRIRQAFSSGAAVAIGGTNGKFKLAQDTFAGSVSASAGIISISVEEAVS